MLTFAHHRTHLHGMACQHQNRVRPGQALAWETTDLSTSVSELFSARTNSDDGMVTRKKRHSPANSHQQNWWRNWKFVIRPWLAALGGAGSVLDETASGRYIRNPISCRHPSEVTYERFSSIRAT